MKLLISADHAGYSLKEELKKAASQLGVTFEDLGTHSTESVDYPDYSRILCERLINDAKTAATPPLGVLLCGSGVGVSIAANRFHGIRAVLAESPMVARLGREHNHANVLCMGARIVSVSKAIEILKAFLETTPSDGDRHLRRIEKLSDPESCKT